MLKITIETDSGSPYEFVLNGEAGQFKQLWEKAEAAAESKRRDTLSFAAAVTELILQGDPCKAEDEWGRNMWTAYAVLSAVSDKLRIDYPAMFEIAAREKLAATIRRGADSPFSIDINAEDLK